MHQIIKDILNGYDKKEKKSRILDSLMDDICVAKDILSGKLTYCKECDDYYLSKSFLTEYKTIPARICVYEDYINSGGNEYVDGYADITYSVCPKGHKHEIDRKERRK